MVLLLAFAFVKFSDDVVEREYVTFDRIIALGVHATATPTQTAIMLFVTNFGKDYLIVLTVVAALIALVATIRAWRRGGEWPLTALYGFAPVVSVGVAGVLAIIVKDVVGRARPHIFPPLAPEIGPSFPSGHAITSLAFYGMCAYVLAYGRPPGIKALCFVAGAAVVLLIAYSRIYLGVHYPTDVMGSFLLGLAWLLAAILAIRQIAPHLRRATAAVVTAPDQTPDASRTTAA